MKAVIFLFILGSLAWAENAEDRLKDFNQRIELKNKKIEMLQNGREEFLKSREAERAKKSEAAQKYQTRVQIPWDEILKKELEQEELYIQKNQRLELQRESARKRHQDRSLQKIEANEKYAIDAYLEFDLEKNPKTH